MATAETIHLTESHPPKSNAIKSFTSILPEVKQKLVHMRQSYDKHEKEYFQGVASLSDEELTAFDDSDLVAVRAGKVAYGVIIFGKVKLPKAHGKYVFVRWIASGGTDDDDVTDGEAVYKLHSIYTEEKEQSDGSKTFRAIMDDKDELSFFNE